MAQEQLKGYFYEWTHADTPEPVECYPGEGRWNFRVFCLSPGSKENPPQLVACKVFRRLLKPDGTWEQEGPLNGAAVKVYNADAIHVVRARSPNYKFLVLIWE